MLISSDFELQSFNKPRVAMVAPTKGPVVADEDDEEMVVMTVGYNLGLVRCDIEGVGLYNCVLYMIHS